VTQLHAQGALVIQDIRTLIPELVGWLQPDQIAALSDGIGLYRHSYLYSSRGHLERSAPREPAAGQAQAIDRLLLGCTSVP